MTVIPETRDQWNNASHMLFRENVKNGFSFYFSLITLWMCVSVCCFINEIINQLTRRRLLYVVGVGGVFILDRGWQAVERFMNRIAVSLPPTIDVYSEASRGKFSFFFSCFHLFCLPCDSENLLFEIVILQTFVALFSLFLLRVI